MAEGRAPASRSRTTRCVSTCVFPEPALADTQAERLGSEASDCWTVVQPIQVPGSSPSGRSAGSVIDCLFRFGSRPFGHPCKVIVIAAEFKLLRRDEAGRETF